MGSDMRVLRASWTKNPPDYGDNSPFFTIEIHHGGDVEYDIDDGTPIFYTGGKVSYFDFCNMQLFTIAELHTMVEELGYDPNKQWYFMMPEPDQWQTINSDSDVELFIASRVKTRKPRRRRTGETNNDTQQSEIPHAPVQRTCETEFGNNFQDAFQDTPSPIQRNNTEPPTSPSPSFLDMYQRSFGSVMGSQGGGTSSNSEVPTVMQRQARLSQPTNDAPRTVSSRGEKLMFSSQPRS